MYNCQDLIDYLNFHNKEAAKHLTLIANGNLYGYKDYYDRSLSQLLLGLFSWNDSLQGCVYWMTVCGEIAHKEHQE